MMSVPVIVDSIIDNEAVNTKSIGNAILFLRLLYIGELGGIYGKQNEKYIGSSVVYSPAV